MIICRLDPLVRLARKEAHDMHGGSHLVSAWRVWTGSGDGGVGRGCGIRRSGSCYGAATAGSGCCCSLSGWAPSCPPQTACPNTGCCSHAAEWVAEDTKTAICEHSADTHTNTSALYNVLFESCSVIVSLTPASSTVLQLLEWRKLNPPGWLRWTFTDTLQLLISHISQKYLSAP